MKERINWIDWAKVIAITAVVIGHTKFIEPNPFIKTLIYNFHIPLFFFLSGFLFKENGDIKLWFQKAMRTLIIPYILLNVIALFFSLVIPYNSYPLTTQLHAFLIGIGNAMPAGPCWFLISLFFVQLASHFLIKMRLPYQLSLLILTPIITFQVVKQFNISTNFTIIISVIASIFFMAGYYCKKYNLLQLKSFTFRLLMSVVLLLLLIYASLFQKQVDLFYFKLGSYPILYYPISFLGIFTFIFISMLFNSISSTFIRNLSSGTILILAFHHIIANTIIPYISYILFGEYPYDIISNVSVSIITIILF